MQGGINEFGVSNEHDAVGTEGAPALSALMDGELEGGAAEREIIRLKADGSAREAWDTYHLIGDVMRGTGGGARENNPLYGLRSERRFRERFSQQLALEPTVLSPVSIPDRQAGRGLSRKIQSYALSAAASVAAVAAVGWVAMNTLKPDNGPAQLAQLARAPLVQSQPQLQTLQPQALAPAGAPIKDAKAAKDKSDEQIDQYQYLLAHQGISPTTVIQGVTPYIRTVSSADE